MLHLRVIPILAGSHQAPGARQDCCLTYTQRGGNTPPESQVLCMCNNMPGNPELTRSMQQSGFQHTVLQPSPKKGTNGAP